MMTDDPNQPVVLATLPTDVQAALIVAALRERGIEARSVGELTSGFRAEAPGGVKILVRQADLDRAQVALRAVEADRRGNNDA
jgi:hypothetical protein